MRVRFRRVLTKTSPGISVISIELENILEIFYSFVELFLRAKNQADGIHCWDRTWVMAERMLISRYSFIKIIEQLSKAPWKKVSATDFLS